MEETFLGEDFNLARFMGDGSYYQLNKFLVKGLGSVSLAMYLTHLIDVKDYLERSGGLRKDGSFFCTQSQVEEKLFFSPYEQNKFVKQLVEKGLIKVKQEGLPYKYYFYLINSNIVKLVLSVKH